ncbi:MAG TPA: orotidine-5'-phosphate decarboxylase [Terriglobales bacterium]|jgi:orotidine-5'-phosphate decarboxylase|nr:orotidine-5'-phosphate decarboxylase [Terriglobales bacterium]
MPTAAEERLIVALDVSTAAAAQKVVAALGESVRLYKVGMQLYTAEGPQLVRDLVSSGRNVFLDLKYHDIPNTVASAVREAAQLGVSMLTVHASGGEKMLRAAAEAGNVAAGVHARPANANVRPLEILAVTVLTSMDESDLHQTGVSGALLDQVLRLASTALDAGCAGVVSSAREVKALRGQLGENFLIVNPGVRPAGADHGDQARVVTPTEAIQAGATHLVVGRPITAAADPVAAARAIQQEIRNASRDRSQNHALRA